MHERAVETFKKILRVNVVPAEVEEVYNRWKVLMDRNDFSVGKNEEPWMCLIAVMAGCDPFGEIEPPRDLDFVCTPRPDDGWDEVEPGSEVIVDWNGKRKGAFMGAGRKNHMVKVWIEGDAEGTTREVSQNRVKVLEPA